MCAISRENDRQQSSVVLRFRNGVCYYFESYRPGEREGLRGNVNIYREGTYSPVIAENVFDGDGGYLIYGYSKKYMKKQTKAGHESDLVASIPRK